MTEREIFATDGEFIICVISDDDRKDYVELHRQLNGETSLYLNPLSKDMMWEQTFNHAENVFSLFTTDGDYCGSIELQHSVTPKAVRLFAKRICEEKKVDYFLIRISSNNLHSQHVFEKMGAVKIGEEESAFSKFVESFGEIAEEKGQNLEDYKYIFERPFDDKN